jgi:hypothetical protein
VRGKRAFPPLPAKLGEGRKAFFPSPSFAGEGQKASSPSPSLARGGEKASIFEIFTFNLCDFYVQDFTQIYRLIWDFHIRDFYIRKKFMAPKIA